MVLLGVGCMILGAIQHKSYVSTLPPADVPRTHSAVFPISLALILAALGLVLAIYLAFPIGLVQRRPRGRSTERRVMIMKTFLRDRGLSLALVVVIMFLIAISQSGISSSFALGRLRNHLPTVAPLIVGVLLALQVAFVALSVVLWTLNRRRALFNVIVIANTVFTVMLLLYTSVLMEVLAGLSSRSAVTLITDVALIAVSNILIFSSGIGLSTHQVWSRFNPAPTMGFPLPAARKRSAAFRVVDSPLQRLPCWSSQPASRSARPIPASDAKRQDAHAPAIHYFRRHIDGDCRKRNQHPCRWELIRPATQYSAPNTPRTRI